MDSIHRTYAHCIKPVPSEEFWTVTNQFRPAPPPIKRPIGRPKVHSRNKDPAEAHIQGDKLKRSFQDLNQSQGENYAETSAVQEQSAPASSGLTPLAAPMFHQVPAATLPAPPVQTLFRPPAQLPRMDQPRTRAAASKFRAKQTIVRLPTSSNPTPAGTPNPPQTQSTTTSGVPSKETLKAASSGTTRISRFIPTPGSKH
ncbi:hypothetical protein Ahy_B02g059040 [Arachis hypogaea]|uniref:Uncharacterized protein n=1 Tax=Arachis hypogaea TaxID=3818 RepID=A0A445AFY4_ARAHY|nr:hypothetical protein Ahy_B02g059040 [Arachis hypogaea]